MKCRINPAIESRLLAAYLVVPSSYENLSTINKTDNLTQHKCVLFVEFALCDLGAGSPSHPKSTYRTCRTTSTLRDSKPFKDRGVIKILFLLEYI